MCLKTYCLKMNTTGNYIQAYRYKKKFTGVCKGKTKMVNFILLCFLAIQKKNKTINKSSIKNTCSYSCKYITTCCNKLFLMLKAWLHTFVCNCNNECVMNVLISALATDVKWNAVCWVPPSCA